MSLDKIRKDIDVLDGQIRDLLLKRLDYAEDVVQEKIERGITDIYLADRERDIIANMNDGVPGERKKEITSFARKMVEVSRMHQYSILYNKTANLFEPLLEDVEIPANPTAVRIELIRPNTPGQVAIVCGLISDYRHNVMELKQMDNSTDNTEARLWITIEGSIHDSSMQKILIQLAQESLNFEILDVR